MVITSAKLQPNGWFVNGTTSIPNTASNQTLIDNFVALGGVIDPIQTPAEAASELYHSKWNQINDQIEALTVTIAANGHKYAANKTAMNEINIKISSLNGTETVAWYEQWGSFTTTQAELQEVVILACQAEQAIIDQVMGV